MMSRAPSPARQAASCEIEDDCPLKPHTHTLTKMSSFAPYSCLSVSYLYPVLIFLSLSLSVFVMSPFRPKSCRLCLQGVSSQQIHCGGTFNTLLYVYSSKTDSDRLIVHTVCRSNTSFFYCKSDLNSCASDQYLLNGIHELS